MQPPKLGGSTAFPATKCCCLCLCAGLLFALIGNAGQPKSHLLLVWLLAAQSGRPSVKQPTMDTLLEGDDA